MLTSLVSIIIPCYNAEKYISETIYSILKQKHVLFEIIIIDDGSSDESKNIIHQFSDSRIFYFYQENKGVSVARNTGLSKAKGEFVIFFDADDLMTDDFLIERVSYLNNNFKVDFVCSLIKKIDELNLEIGHLFFNGYTDEFSNDILKFNQTLTTCPSNYLFRKSFLLKNNLIFNERLSSSADKYFMLNCNMFGNGFQLINGAFLLYRISPTGMSQILSIKLINDNIKLENEILLILNSDFNRHVIREFLAKNGLSISISFFKIKIYHKAIIYLFKSLFNNPKVIINYLFEKYIAY
jgi:teichuronic acid biosynthesis glycosyltransferase TuaG